MGVGTRSWRLGQEEILQPYSNSLPPPIHFLGWCRGLGRCDSH